MVCLAGMAPVLVLVNISKIVVGLIAKQFVCMVMH